MSPEELLKQLSSYLLAMEFCREVHMGMKRELLLYPNSIWEQHIDKWDELMQELETYLPAPAPGGIRQMKLEEGE